MKLDNCDCNVTFAKKLIITHNSDTSKVIGKVINKTIDNGILIIEWEPNDTLQIIKDIDVKQLSYGIGYVPLKKDKKGNVTEMKLYEVSVSQNIPNIPGK